MPVDGASSPRRAGSPATTHRGHRAGEVVPPGRASIARALIEDWFGQGWSAPPGSEPPLASESALRVEPPSRGRLEELHGVRLERQPDGGARARREAGFAAHDHITAVLAESRVAVRVRHVSEVFHGLDVREQPGSRARAGPGPAGSRPSPRRQFRTSRRPSGSSTTSTSPSSAQVCSTRAESRFIGGEPTKPLDIRVGRVLVEHSRRVALQQNAVPQHGDAVAHGHRLGLSWVT